MRPRGAHGRFSQSPATEGAPVYEMDEADLARYDQIKHQRTNSAWATTGLFGTRSAASWDQWKKGPRPAARATW